MEPWYKVAIPRHEVREGRSFNPDEFAIALEQVVGEDDRRRQVAQRIAHAVLHRVRQRRVVPAGHRLQDKLVDRVVDVEQVAVQRLDRIVRLLVGGHRLRIPLRHLRRRIGTEDGKLQFIQAESTPRDRRFRNDRLFVPKTAFASLGQQIFGRRRVVTGSGTARKYRKQPKEDDGKPPRAPDSHGIGRARRVEVFEALPHCGE